MSEKANPQTPADYERLNEVKPEPASAAKQDAGETRGQAHGAGRRADYDKAVDKLRDEMAASKSRYIQVVGDYLTGYLRGHPAAAGAILAKDKTIAGSLAAMRKEAEKVKDGGVAVLDDETAFGIVLAYYGIKGEATETSSVTGKAGDTFPIGEGIKGDADLDLDALLAL